MNDHQACGLADALPDLSSPIAWTYLHYVASLLNILYLDLDTCAQLAALCTSTFLFGYVLLSRGHGTRYAAV